MIRDFFESRSERKRPSGRSVRISSKDLGASDRDSLKHCREQGCEGCPLFSEDLKHPKLKPTGRKRPEIYILGEAPGADEDRKGRQFVGDSGKLIREVLDSVGLRSLRWDNTCRCRPPKNRTPTREEMERCRLPVMRSINRAKPKVLLAVGSVALMWSLGESSILQWRGRRAPVTIGSHTCWVYPILHPAFVKRATSQRDFEGSNDWKLVFHNDLNRLSLDLSDGLESPEMIQVPDLDRDVHYATDRNSLKQFFFQLKKWARGRIRAGVDIETIGLRPYSGDPVQRFMSFSVSDWTTTWSVPISHPEAPWIMPVRAKILRAIRDFLAGPNKKIAHNTAFELEWFNALWPDVSFPRNCWEDTQQQSYCLDERRGVHDLDTCCLENLGIRLKDVVPLSKDDKLDMSRVPLQTLLRYNAFDSKVLQKLFVSQERRLHRSGLTAVYQRQVRRTQTLVSAQRVGLLVNLKRAEGFRKRLDKQATSLMTEILQTKEARRYKQWTGRSLSITSPKQLTILFRDILERREGVREKTASGYSVDDATLEAIKLPISKLIQQWRSTQKLNKTYVDPCSRVGGLVYEDHRLHTNLNSTVTVTGRLSSDDPNVQNFPKRKESWVRRMVVAPPGHLMLAIDYGQMEPRVIGMSSKDRVLCKSFEDRHDIHLEWAEKIAEVDSKTYRRHGRKIKVLRQEVKSNWVLAGFYGSVYGAISKRMGGLSPRCEDLFEEFRERHPGVWAWQRRQLKHYNECGYVVGLTGRHRRAPLTTNQILNNPTQGAASDIVVAAMDRLSRKAEKEDVPAYQPVLNIHDDLTFYIPKKDLDWMMPEIVRVMLAKTNDWMIIPLSVEVSVGPNWGQLEEIGTYFSDELP